MFHFLARRPRPLRFAAPGLLERERLCGADLLFERDRDRRGERDRDLDLDLDLDLDRDRDRDLRGRDRDLEFDRPTTGPAAIPTLRLFPLRETISNLSI